MYQSFEKVFNSKIVEENISEIKIGKKPNQGHQFDLFNIPGGGNNELAPKKKTLSTVNHFYQFCMD